MYLKNLIEYLEKTDKSIICPMGFGNPHSYRGYYEDLAFEPIENISVEDMLDYAKYALGKTFEGYKGGDYKMKEYTEVWLAHPGHTGEGIGKVLLDYMVGKYKK